MADSTAFGRTGSRTAIAPAVVRSASMRSSISPELSRTLDVLRGIAAILVVIQHARTYLFADIEALPTQPLAVRGVYFITGFGHAAVMIFFVLSGFLVGGRALADIESGHFSWRGYLLQRGTRLWVVLFPALVLTAAWDHAGLLITAHPYTLAAHFRTNTLGAYAWTVEGHGLGAFIGNALFLTNILVPTFGTNGALWSLGSEFWYYVLFPLAAIAVVEGIGRRSEARDARPDRRRLLIAVALLALLAWWIEWQILEWGAIWLIGTAVARMPRLRLSRRASVRLAGAFGVALVGVLAFHRITTNDITFARDATAGGLCALVLYALRCAPDDASDDASERGDESARVPSRLAAPFIGIAGFSYTLYLVHEPPLALLREWIIARPHLRWTPTPVHLAVGAAVVVVLFVYGYALSRVTEAHTRRVRAWLQRRLETLHPSLAPAARVARIAPAIAPTPTWQTIPEG